MSKIIWIQSDDWNVIYLNNKLKYQGHHILDVEWWELAQENTDVGFNDIKTYWISDEDFCNFPKNFNKIDKALLED